MGKKGGKPPAPGTKSEKSTNFFTKKKWRSVLQNTSVEVCGRSLDPRGAFVLSYAISKNNYIKKLDFSNNCIGDEGAVAIADMLRVNQLLQYLNLSQNGITDIGGIALASAFIPSVSPTGVPGQWNRSLFTLCLACNELGDDTLLAMSNATACNRDLTKVDLSYNKVGPQGTKALLRCFQRNPLVNFTLVGNNIGDEGATHMADALKHYGGRSQTTLNLYRNGITHRGAEAIGRLLENNSFLMDVNLAGNSIGQKGIHAIKNSIVNFSNSLRFLNVSDNLLGDEGAKELAEIIAADLSLLIRLDCSDNQITDKGATTICKSLRANTALQMIDCQNNSFGPKAVIAVEEVVKETQTLKSMNLSNCVESSDARRHLTLIVGETEGVHVELGNSGIGDDDNIDVPDKLAEYLQVLADQEAQRQEELKKAGKLNKKKKKKEERPAGKEGWVGPWYLSGLFALASDIYTVFYMDVSYEEKEEDIHISPPRKGKWEGSRLINPTPAILAVPYPHPPLLTSSNDAFHSCSTQLLLHTLSFFRHIPLIVPPFSYI
eukprot:gene8812-6197_t